MRSSKAAGVTEVALEAEFYQIRLSHMQRGRQTHRHDMCPNPSLNVEQRLLIRFLLGNFNRNLDFLWAALMPTSNYR